MKVIVIIFNHSFPTYIKTGKNQCKENLIRSCENDYGKIPKTVMPDNLKSAVCIANRYAPSLIKEGSEHFPNTIERGSKPLNPIYFQVKKPLRRQPSKYKYIIH